MSSSDAPNKENDVGANRDISKTVKLMKKLERPADYDTDSEPLSPYTSWLPKYTEEEPEEDVIDLPDRLMSRADAGQHVQDLQRQSVKVGQELRSRAEMSSIGLGHSAEFEGHDNDNFVRTSRVQGELFVKMGFLIRAWRRRYGSVVEHSYFGPVLFLFKYDGGGKIEVGHSDMIALTDTSVTAGKSKRRALGAACRWEFTLKTSRKKYLLATSDPTSRDLWMKHLS